MSAYGMGVTRTSKIAAAKNKKARTPKASELKEKKFEFFQKRSPKETFGRHSPVWLDTES